MINFSQTTIAASLTLAIFSPSKRPTINCLIERLLSRSPFANSANLFANGYLIGKSGNGRYPQRRVWLLRFTRRIAFFFSRRRTSLLETCQRRRRTSLNIWLLVTSLRKRRNNCSWDSFERNSTDGNMFSLSNYKLANQTETCSIKAV